MLPQKCSKRWSAETRARHASHSVPGFTPPLHHQSVRYLHLTESNANSSQTTERNCPPGTKHGNRSGLFDAMFLMRCSYHADVPCPGDSWHLASGVSENLQLWIFSFRVPIHGMVCVWFSGILLVIFCYHFLEQACFRKSIPTVFQEANMVFSTKNRKINSLF